MEKRPRIPIKLTTTDYLFEIIGVVGIACLIFLPIYFYADLPNIIPKHFNTLGQVDSYGKRGVIWLLPTIGLVLYVGMTILNKYPFAFNYPTKVTYDNAERLYTLGTRTVRLLKVVVTLSFLFLNFKTIEIALNRADGIGKFYLLIFLIVLGTLIGTMIYKMTKNRTRTHNKS
ncbi:DUF1648 domain-containing protein [Labilibaculum sp. DW002]|uniref:DUF1648 domain-containing protein n=1 Tax=Paralabilibaculum antarcticum TaxID=2912572 RepID=A0ABT5VWC5_9BACT|nr:DUF1648 domain-containing protein [Labilibaculum sp. DW002]MDE5419597.1 DUF1648 domain-containing protein [Labilibaculum sp. DW002]